jgi:hypothetical protein
MDSDYLMKRFRMHRRLAQAAVHPAARRAHETLAEAYRASLDGGPALASPDSMNLN